MAAAGEDWRNGKSLIECNRYMLENELHTDVTFCLRSNLILAHRTILMSRSQVFESMLTGQPATKMFLITDVEPDDFKEMLR